MLLQKKSNGRKLQVAGCPFCGVRIAFEKTVLGTWRFHHTCEKEPRIEIISSGYRNRLEAVRAWNERSYDYYQGYLFPFDRIEDFVDYLEQQRAERELVECAALAATLDEDGLPMASDRNNAEDCAEWDIQ